MNKIEALEKTIFDLEHNVYPYAWGNCNNCNCGLLARTLLNGEGAMENGLLFNGPGEGFSGVVKNAFAYCSNTGIELPKVFKVLHEAGFTTYELKRLEDATFHKDELIKYYKEWVAILKPMEEVQPPLPEPQVKEKKVYVTISECLREEIPMEQFN